MASKRAATKPPAIEPWSGGPDFDRPTDETTLDDFADDLHSLVHDIHETDHKNSIERAHALIRKYESDGSYRPDKLYQHEWSDMWANEGTVAILPYDQCVPHRETRQSLHEALVALGEFAMDDGASATQSDEKMQKLVSAATKYAERRGRCADAGSERERGVSLFDIAYLIEEDDIAATNLVKRLVDSKRLNAMPIGRCPDDGRRQLYRSSELLTDVAKILGLTANDKAKYWQGLTARARRPALG